MKITPVGDRIYLGTNTLKKIGDLDLSSKKSVNQWATVTSVGPDVTSVEKGDLVLYEPWALVSVNYEGEEHFFISESSNGICGIVTQ